MAQWLACWARNPKVRGIIGKGASCRSMQSSIIMFRNRRGSVSNRRGSWSQCPCHFLIDIEPALSTNVDSSWLLVSNVPSSSWQTGPTPAVHYRYLMPYRCRWRCRSHKKDADAFNAKCVKCSFAHPSPPPDPLQTPSSFKECVQKPSIKTKKK